MTKPIWLFCDFDNTLMGTEALALPSLIARFNMLYAQQIGRELTLSEFYANFQGLAWESLCDAMSKYFKIHVEFDLLYADRDWNMIQHFKAHGVPMADHLLESFAALQKQNVRFAIVSNMTIQRNLAAMRYATNGRGDELMAFFGTHIYQPDGVYKPDPTVYLRAMIQADATPEHSFAVEDSPTGARSALAAGLRTFGFTGFAEHKERRAQELQHLGVRECFVHWNDFPALLQPALAR